LITYEYDAKTLAQVEKKLGALKSEAPKALKNAINATAKQARKELAQEAQKTYVVKSGRFNKAMTIKNATQGNLEATIKATGAPMELKDFKVSPASVKTGKSRPSMTKGKVLASSGLKNLQKGNIKAFVAKFSSGHATVAQRQGSARLPIKTLYSNSIPKMIGNEKRVYGVVKPNIESNLRENINKQVRKILEA
jgi:3-deoxy-D-arabino-heptulosonate 7-phosphate (DAHP) synthase